MMDMADGKNLFVILPPTSSGLRVVNLSGQAATRYCTSKFSDAFPPGPIFNRRLVALGLLLAFLVNRHRINSHISAIYVRVLLAPCLRPILPLVAPIACGKG